LLEDLYGFINPAFKDAKVNEGDRSFTDSLHYHPKENFINHEFENYNASDSNKSGWSLFSFDNGADLFSQKLASLNYCESPIEKTYMISWIAESIRQDSHTVNESQKALPI
jgi:hypothetical protein